MTEWTQGSGSITAEPMEYGEFAANVHQWAHDRNLVHGSKPKDQFFKLVEEYGELCESSIPDDDIKGMADSIGDCAVVIGVISPQLDIPFERLTDDYIKVESDDPVVRTGAAIGMLSKALKNPLDSTLWVEAVMQHFIHSLIDVAGDETTFKRCLRVSWNEIKDRKGKMVDGVFVKET